MNFFLSLLTLNIDLSIGLIFLPKAARIPEGEYLV